jgi:hypothetical protein
MGAYTRHLLIIIPWVVAFLASYGAYIGLWAARQSDDQELAKRLLAAVVLNGALSAWLLSSYHANGVWRRTLLECILVSVGFVALFQAALSLTFAIAPPGGRRAKWPPASRELLWVGLFALVFLAWNGLGGRHRAASVSAIVVALALLAMAVPAKGRAGAEEEA